MIPGGGGGGTVFVRILEILGFLVHHSNTNTKTPDFRNLQTPNFHVLVLFAVIIRKHPIFVVWCWGNSQSPDRIYAKIAFFVAKTDFCKKKLSKHFCSVCRSFPMGK
jgi:hypothetical protein